MITSFFTGYILAVGRVRCETAQVAVMTSQQGVPYDVRHRKARRHCLGGGWGLHIAQPGNVTHWRFHSRYATRDVTVTGGGYTLHNLEACGLSYNGACVTYSIGRWMRETGASRTATRDVTVKGGFTYCTTVKRYLFDRNECAPFIILL